MPPDLPRIERALSANGRNGGAGLLPIGIILGARVYGDGTASPALKRRARHGARLWREGKVATLIASGGPHGAPCSEASAIARICQEGGVAAKCVTEEENARNTLENIRFSMALLPRGTPAILITDRFHAPRARLIARRLGLNATISSPPIGKLPMRRRLRIFVRELLACSWTWLSLWR